MAKNQSGFQWGGSVLFSLLLLLVFKAFAFAEEARITSTPQGPSDGSGKALQAFQRDLIQAQQKKQPSLSPQATSIESLDQERSRRLAQEAERLIEEWSKKREFGGRVDLKLTPASEPKAPKGPTKKNKAWYESFPNPLNRRAATFKAPEIPSEDTEQPSAGKTLLIVAMSDNRLTLAEAVDIGLANNTQILADKRKIEVAEAKLAEARRALWPVVQGSFDKNGGRSPSGSRIYVGQSEKINISQPLYYGGELVNTVKQGEAALRGARAEYEKNRNDFIHQVRAAYYGLVNAEYNAQYQAELEKAVGVIYERTRKEFEQKVVSEVDTLNVESQYYQVVFQSEASRNDSLSSAMVLKSTLGLTNEDRILPDLSLRYRKIDSGFSALLKLAYYNNADLKTKLHALASAYYGVEVYRSKKLPKIDLRGSFGLLGETFDDEEALPLDLEKEWFLGLHGSMPLGAHSVEYDFGRHFFAPTISAFQGSEDWRHHVAVNAFDKLSDITDTKNAEATYLQAQSDFEKARNEVTLKVREDFYKMRKSMIQVDSAMSKIKYQEKQNRILEYLVGHQEASVTSYVENLIESAQDRFSFIQAVTDYEIAKSSLGVALGDPYYFDNPQ